MLERMSPHLGLFMSAEFLSEHLPVFKLARKCGGCLPIWPPENSAAGCLCGQVIPFLRGEEANRASKSGMVSQPQLLNNGCKTPGPCGFLSVIYLIKWRKVSQATGICCSINAGLCFFHVRLKSFKRTQMVMLPVKE